MGVLASRAIHAGEEIIAEIPLISVCTEFGIAGILRSESVSTRAEQMLAEAVGDALEGLSTEAQATFFALSRAKSLYAGIATSHHLTLGIFRTNALQTSAAIGSVFATCSRFNHSCQPNLSHRWDRKQGTLVLRAMRDIACGTELTISYREEYLEGSGVPCTARRKQLWTDFGFWCACERCAYEERNG